MTVITTQDIMGQLRSYDYALVRSDTITLGGDLASAWAELRSFYPDLPLDEYLPDGGKYRFRRFGRMYFLPVTGDLVPMPHVDYFQSLDHNKVTGGIVRKFAPLSPAIFANAFMQALIRFNMAHFPLDDAMRAQPWQVDIHLIRVTTQPDVQGQPTPEGIHCDGAEFVTVHLAEINNVTGGEVTIYDLTEKPLTQLTLNTLLDSYLFNDRRVLHGVTPVRPADGVSTGLRSILTFDYHHVPDLQRPDV